MAPEIITRRDLPHWYVPGASHFVTFRLAESLPRVVLDRLTFERERLLRAFDGRTIPAHEREKIHKQCFGRYDAELDRGIGPTYLGQPKVAAVVRQSLYFLDGKHYHLLAYCIMPNHVHVLFQPLDHVEVVGENRAVGEEKADLVSPLSRIMHSLKSYTAHRINAILGRSGKFWQSESYDHWVRDDDELERIVQYIANNPVKAALVQFPHDWYFCSAHDRFLQDGSEHTWLDLTDRGTGVSPVQLDRGTGETPVQLDRGTGVSPVHLTTGETPMPRVQITTGETPVPRVHLTTGETPVPRSDSSAESRP